MCDCPPPGGEPLWDGYGDLAIFVSARDSSKKCRSRRLPRVTQRKAGLRSGSESEATSECIALGSSRKPPVFTHFGRTSVETKIAGWPGTFQSGSPPGDREPHNNFFEDEDDDEYENECDGVSALPDGPTFQSKIRLGILEADSSHQIA
jgi:hypothetical protein